ncbi:MarR family transcriptional regulator [Desulfovibrio inopinatus]|uniref:MarR family transcriptional regulator n=1 Tax=Desulfovibrio inopinatus TaxID=102109 RepID=UPI001B7FB70D|nr:MarR family transcriptional regulator [Desulfovibrio inopinatus]
MLSAYAAQFDEMDTAATKDALHMMRNASLLLRELEAYFRSQQLSQTRFLILIILDREPERDAMSAKDILQRLDVSKPVLTTTLQSLSKAGFITIDKAERDSRSLDIRLTSQGKHKLKSLLPGYFSIIATFMRTNSSKDLDSG